MSSTSPFNDPCVDHIHRKSCAVRLLTAAAVTGACHAQVSLDTRQRCGRGARLLAPSVLASAAAVVVADSPAVLEDLRWSLRCGSWAEAAGFGAYPRLRRGDCGIACDMGGVGESSAAGLPFAVPLWSWRPPGNTPRSRRPVLSRLSSRPCASIPTPPMCRRRRAGRCGTWRCIRRIASGCAGTMVWRQSGRPCSATRSRLASRRAAALASGQFRGRGGRAAGSPGFRSAAPGGFFVLQSCCVSSVCSCSFHMCIRPDPGRSGVCSERHPRSAQAARAALGSQDRRQLAQWTWAQGC